MGLTRAQSVGFQKTLQMFFTTNRRAMPWREAEADGSYTPYKILVSEIMLQQTQVPRVMPKYLEFIGNFPDVRALAEAPLGDVLGAWQGLGYNRRAKFLWQAAQKVVQDFDGVFPQTSEELQMLPGVGVNTAGAVLAYAFNQPAIFIETNIRTIFIHHFFKDQASVSDIEIRELLTQLISKNNPREFYWSLMDYGAFLKGQFGNLSKASKHYTKQSKFEGSRRQVRGQVLRLLAAEPLTEHQLQKAVADQRLINVLAELCAEGLIRRAAEYYQLG